MTDSISFFRPEEKDLYIWVDIRKKILSIYMYMTGTSSHRIKANEIEVYKPTDFTDSDWDLLKVRFFPAVERLAFHYNTVIRHIEYPDWQKELLGE